MNRVFFFNEPDSPQLVTAGITREWPDARGVFVSALSGLGVFVNEEEHLRITVTQDDADLQTVFARLCMADVSIRASLQAEGTDYDCGRMGLIAACPFNLGAGLRATVRLRLPRLSEVSKTDQKAAVSKLGLAARTVNPDGDVFELSSTMNRLMGSVSEQLDSLVSGCAALVREEEAGAFECLGV